jgi:hypothetical protein
MLYIPILRLLDGNPIPVLIGVYDPYEHSRWWCTMVPLDCLLDAVHHGGALDDLQPGTVMTAGISMQPVKTDDAPETLLQRDRLAPSHYTCYYRDPATCCWRTLFNLSGGAISALTGQSAHRDMCCGETISVTLDIRVTGVLESRCSQ